MTSRHVDRPGEPLTIRVAHRDGRRRLTARRTQHVELPLKSPPADEDELRRLLAQYLEIPTADIDITTRRRRRRPTITVAIRH